MHGFIGCVEPDQGAVDRMLRWVRQWMDLAPGKAAYEIRRAPFVFTGSKEPGCTDTPVASDQRGLSLAFAGFIAKDQLWGPDGKEPPTDAQVADALLSLYRERGPEALAALNGRYVVAVWDPASGTLNLMNDALGLKPVFLWRQGDTFVFSSNVWAIACHPEFPKAIDPRGLADMLLLSCQQDNRTLHKDVCVLAPGGVTTVRDGRLAYVKVRNLKFSEERWDWSIEKTADGMRDMLAQSIRRTVPEGSEVRLPLSGGLDSRVLLAFLSERPVTVHAVTECQRGLFNEDIEGELRYAKRVVRALRVDHALVPLTHDVFARYRTKCVAINGGLYDIHTGRFLSLMELAPGGCMPTVSGHLGGELTSRFQKPDTSFFTPEEHFELAFGGVNRYRFSPSVARELMEGHGAPDLVEESVQDCRQFFLDFAGRPFQRYFHWDLLLCRRRYISYQLAYYEQFHKVIAPFSDLDFVDFMCSVPFAAILDQRAYRAMLCRQFPVLARIPNTTSGAPLTPSTKAILRHCLSTQLLRFVRRPLQRALRRWISPPMFDAGFFLSGASKPVLDHILKNKDRLAAYLNPHRVQNAIDRQLKGDFSSSIGLLGLSAFVTALEMMEDPYAAIRAWTYQDPAAGAVHEAIPLDE